VLSTFREGLLPYPGSSEQGDILKACNCFQQFSSASAARLGVLPLSPQQGLLGAWGKLSLTRQSTSPCLPFRLLVFYGTSELETRTALEPFCCYKQLTKTIRKYSQAFLSAAAATAMAFSGKGPVEGCFIKHTRDTRSHPT